MNLLALSGFGCFGCAVLVGALSVAAVPVPALTGEGSEEQLRLFVDAAEHGSPRAMLAIAYYNENGIGMPTNRAEAVRWYRGVLSARSGSTKDVIEAAEEGLVRLGADALQFDAASTNGNYFLGLIAAQTNRESAYLTCAILRNKLIGRTLVFTNMVAGYVQHRKDGIIKLLLDVPRELRTYDRDDFHRFRIDPSATFYFDAANSKPAAFLDREDKIVRIEGEVVTNWTWQTGGLALKGVSVEPLDKTLMEPLPEFDAENITGDGLLEYFRQQRLIRKWHYDEIQSRLAGRRLVFHNLRLSGSSGSQGEKFDSSFWIEAVPSWERVGEGDVVGSARFKLSFATDSARRFARSLVRAGSFARLHEVSGTFVKVEDPDDGWALQLKDVALVPQGADFDIGDDGKGPLPGDEIVRRIGRDFTPVAKLSLCSRFAGREIDFSSGVVTACNVDWISNSVSVVCRVAPQNRDSGRSRPMHVAFVIPSEKAMTLRRTPIVGDLVVGLKGRIMAIDDDGSQANGSLKRGLDSGTLEIEFVDGSITWKSDVAKTAGLETKPGERIVRRLGLCWSEVRQDQFLRLAQQVDGKEVAFPSGKVHNSATGPDGSVSLTVGLEDPLLGECVELTFVVASGKLAEQAAVLKYGTRLRNIRGVLKVELSRPNGWGPERKCVTLKDAFFELVPQSKVR